MDQNFFTQNPAFQNISPEKLAFLMNFMNQEKPRLFQGYDDISYEFCHKGKKSESLFYDRRNRFYYPASAAGTKSHRTAAHRPGVADAAQEKVRQKTEQNPYYSAQSFSNYMRHFKLSSPLFVSINKIRFIVSLLYFLSCFSASLSISSLFYLKNIFHLIPDIVPSWIKEPFH